MKKILLLSTMSLAMLMADITLIEEQLTKASERVAEAPPPATTAPVNTSGIIPNSVDLIWADMHDAPTGWPVATNSSYSQFQGPTFKGKLPTRTEGWGSVNAWFEVEPATCKKCSCDFDISTSVNTAVELSPIYAFVLTNDGVWHQYSGTNNSFGGATFPSKSILFKGNRGCNVQPIEDIRAANMGYDAQIRSRTYLPQYYLRYHGWANNARYKIDRSTIKAVFFTHFARLTKIDPNGVDDFKKAEFVVHGASDIKAADGTQIPGKEGWGVGGISRYKIIPQDGNWMPVNFIEGWITKAELDANPPPFPKHP